MKYPLLLIVFLALISCTTNPKSISESLSIDKGDIRGMFDNESGVHIYKGIPFAEPPVGNLRWKAPVAISEWEGELNCTAFSASAIQNKPESLSMWTSEFMAPVEPLSEDCLNLNVWTASKSVDEKRPVLVYIHGGAFTGGSGSVPVYDGVSMARKGVVFVTINYRVGIFGFFSHPELSSESSSGTSGNQGILDQIEALKWVQNNISKFGGDPNNVTIAGQSAGAYSVCYLVASPLAKGLFHKAIAQSGGAVFSFSNGDRGNELKQAEMQGIEIAKRLNVNSLEELRSLSASDLQNTGTRTGPIVDGYLIQKGMSEIFENGEQNDVPLITGWNEDEGLHGDLLSAIKFRERVKIDYGGDSEEFLKLFPANNDEEAFESQKNLGVLQAFGIQSYKWMLMQDKIGTSDVFMYNFQRNVPFGKNQIDYGAFHSGELFYTYQNLKASKIRPWKDSDYKLADQMSSYWVNFAKNGNPNGLGLPNWEPVSKENPTTILFDSVIRMVEMPDLQKLEFIDNYYSTTTK